MRTILVRAESYRPPLSIASAIPVSCSVTDVLVMTRGAFGDASEDGQTCRIEVVDDLGAESVLLEGEDGPGERRLVGQRGESVPFAGRTHGFSSFVTALCAEQRAFAGSEIAPVRASSKPLVEPAAGGADLARLGGKQPVPTVRSVSAHEGF